ncbi:M61 family metallopeptidase [Neolewinella antarctica]|uniref:Metalloprotease with PDZ domain n=1 Tax=Neolewinella antarctica TaxID=442734 RepID=A0ABX0XFU1_9BACT|nr:PDZ domain-containing protein [Neolewinella antarctica]NJC28092.1 putative metalloprotease with PDZ domain [Neolewinella antarctica]
MRTFLLVFFSVLSLTGHAQLDWVVDHPGTIVYTLDLKNVQQHELRITADFPAVSPGVFTVRMPQSSPGRYAQHNFAKNVYDLKAYSASGKELSVYPSDVAEWRIAGHGGSVKLVYTLFANGGDGTYSGIDARKLHLNMPATFLYGDELNDRPIILKIKEGQQPDWTMASQLVPLPFTHYGSRDRAAPNYAYFYDSPTLVGTIMRGEFAVENPDGKTQMIELAMMHEGTRAEFDAYLAWTKDVVLTQQRVFGELPDFDYGRYTFLCAYNPWIGGDGMEHRNSTICSASTSLAEAAERLIGTVSHEFFHCWNVERIRPASLEPFNFDHANVSGELWFAEGFTSYFDDLSLVRAGIQSPEDYAAGLTNQLNYVLLSPGRQHRGPIAMSQQAPFVDAATANDPDNFGNTFVSYYPYGSTIGLALDLELRARGQRLDDVMQLMWQRYGKTEIPYHIRDIQLVVGAVAGDQSWAEAWFMRHIYNSELPDFAPYFAEYGLTLRQEQPDSVAFYGLRLRERDGVVSVVRPVPENSPLYAAGLDVDSEIISLNGVSVASTDDWDEVVRDLKIGQTYALKFEQLGVEKTGSFVAVASPKLILQVNKTANAKALIRRASWLNPQ